MGKHRRETHDLGLDEAHDDARYRATFQQAPIGIAHTTPDGTLIDINPALCRILGFTRHELLRMRLSDLMVRRPETAPEESSTAGDCVDRLLVGEITAHARTERYRDEQGNTVWVSRMVSVAADADNAPYLIHVIEDITERVRAADEQRQRDLRYQRTLESALDCIVSTDHLGRIIEFNPMAERVFGYARPDVLGRKLSEVLVPAPLRRRHEMSMNRLLSGDQRSMLNRRIETIAVRADGSTIPVELMMQRLTDTEPPIFTGFLRDISQRKEAEARILRLNRLYRTLSHTSALILRAGDRTALFSGICRIAKEQGGFLMPWVGLIDAESDSLRLEEHCEDESARVPDFPAGGRAREGPGPIATAIRESRIVIVNDAVNPVHDSVWREWNERHGIRSLAVMPLRMRGSVIGVFVLKSATPRFFDDEDIGALLREMADEISYALDRLDLEEKHRDAQSRLSHLAHYDQLTGLPNRGLFCERLLHGIAQAARNAWKLGVVFVDLDRFKTVNDTIGHTAGDELLRQVAARLVECVRGEDTVSRLSGDEFAVVLAHLADVDDAGLVAAKVLRQLERPFRVESVDIVVTASIGITLYPEDGENPDILMRNADVALYNAKARGRNNSQFYTGEMNARALAKLQLESRLRGALARNEFVLHYQPKVDVESGSICGFEALLRWQPPGEALVPPGEFIPLLEETGLITPVGEWVVQAATEQAARWRDAGLKAVPIAINLSARQLRHAGFSVAVANALRDRALEARLIEVEVTESSLMDNPEEARKALLELKTLGVTLAIDDFGTGYSSLAYLKRFPFDTLKIDRSFVRDINTDPEDATIARTIIALAHSLALTVVAEGVETEEQLEFLVANRCDQAQGFLFSKPVPADAATALLEATAPLHPPSPVEAVSTSPAVLVVDGERDHLISLQQLLQRDGYQVLTASGVVDAVDMLARHNIALVIADEMQDRSGVEFLRTVQKEAPQAMRIMLTPPAGPRPLTAAINDGTVQRFFVKGRDEHLLRQEVKKVMRRTFRSPRVVGALSRKPGWGLKLRREKKS